METFSGAVQWLWKTIPLCPCDVPFRVTLRMALAEANASEHVRRAHGFKLFVLLPRMLLMRQCKRWPHQQGKNFANGMGLFNEYLWEDLIRDRRGSIESLQHFKVHRRRRRFKDDNERRDRRAHSLVQLGEVSAWQSRTGSCRVQLPVQIKPEVS